MCLSFLAHALPPHPSPEEYQTHEEEEPVPTPPLKTKAPPAPLRSPSAAMSTADMEANLTQYRLFQEKKKRVGLAFPPFPY